MGCSPFQSQSVYTQCFCWLGRSVSVPCWAGKPRVGWWAFLLQPNQPSSPPSREIRIHIPSTIAISNFPSIKYSAALQPRSALCLEERSSCLSVPGSYSSQAHTVPQSLDQAFVILLLCVYWCSLPPITPKSGNALPPPPNPTPILLQLIQLQGLPPLWGLIWKWSFPAMDPRYASQQQTHISQFQTGGISSWVHMG